MKKHITNLCRYLLVPAAVAAVTAPVDAAAPVNARGMDSNLTAGARNAGRSAARGGDSVATTISENVARTARRNGAIVSRGATTQHTVVNTVNPRSAIRNVTSNPARSAVVTSARSATKANNARSAVLSNSRGGGTHSGNVSTVSRAATARAAAVFNDISKIGSGYAACREAYATCMDQLCANANDTYRRCFCSDRFTDFRDMEYALDEAKNLLMKFEDNNLNAVDKTAAEVAAMYTASEGEAAIKNDTSGAAKMLSEIGDLLSGKKKSTPKTISQSLGVMDLDFTADVGDIWAGGGNGGGSSIFGGGSSVDLTELEGQELYNQAHKQCMSLIADTCENDAVFSMVRSSYSILISQDCNAYEKSLNAKRTAVEQTVRTAEKYLREARLEEYRSHNSADVNECIAQVRTALTKDTACGPNYKRCLDYTGAYINLNTGEPIYSPKLFKMQDLINLSGITDSDNNVSAGDILDSNPQFSDFLDTRKMFAESALDTCRGIADMVWEEFKRTALIEISQAQDEKIEEVKSSCISTMKDCYDTQSEAIKGFDDTTAQTSGALSAYTAKAMCVDKVVACAALYGDGTDCTIDSKGRVTGDNKGRCGLTELLAFVDSVDEVRVGEGCASAIDKYVKDLCTPTADGQEFPWNCRTLTKGALNSEMSVNSIDTANDNSIAGSIARFALKNCSDPNLKDNGGNKVENPAIKHLPEVTRTQITKSVQDIASELEMMMMENCEQMDGFWYSKSVEYGPEEQEAINSAKDLAAFYRMAYGASISNTTNQTWGRCIENTTRVKCLAYNSGTGDENKDGVSGEVARYDATRDECILSDEWYRTRCTMLGNGYYEGGVCYITPEN